MNYEITPGSGGMTYSGHAPSIADKPTPSLTDQVMERLKGILATNGETEAELDMLYDRTFGVSASSGQTMAGAPPPVSGRAEIIIEMLDTLQQRASRAASTARALNGRI